MAQLSKTESLNSESLPGSKLQSDIVDILVKFRKELVALAGDVSQMYHRIDSCIGTWAAGVYQRFRSLRGLFWLVLLPILCPVFLATSCQTLQGDLSIRS